MDITLTPDASVLPDRIWLGGERRQLLVRSASEPDLFRLVTRWGGCTCPGFARRSSCRHVDMPDDPETDAAPVLRVRDVLIRVGPRQMLVPAGSGLWRLDVFPPRRTG